MQQDLQKDFISQYGCASEARSRSEILYLISQWVSNRSIIDVPSLRKYLKANWGKVPIDCGSIQALQGIAFELGVPGAVDEPLKLPSDKIPRVWELKKLKISKEEIKNLRGQGMSLRKIAESAGVSHQRINEILLTI
jgi:hypothetical protein